MSTRYHTLDHWRGIACLMVVICHADLGGHLGSQIGFRSPQCGTIGVGIFFAISGYCITASVYSGRRKETPFLEYWRRRMVRIFPPYWMAIAFVVSVIAATNAMGLELHDDIFEGWRWTPSEVVGNLLLIETWRPLVFGPPPDNLLLKQAWSLCYEEQFYFICGLSLFFAARRYLWMAIGLCAITGVTSILNRLGYVNVAGTFLSGYWLSFAAGIFAYYAIHGSRIERAVSAICLLVLCVASCLIGDFATHIAASSFFAVVAVLLYRWDEAIDSMKPLSGIRWLGTISYSLYLVHMVVCLPMTQVATDAFPSEPWKALALSQSVGIALSILIAWPFHVLCERPFISASRSRLKTPEPSPPPL